MTPEQKADPLFSERVLVAVHKDHGIESVAHFGNVKEAVAALTSGRFDDGTYEILTRARTPLTIRTRQTVSVEVEGGEPTIRRSRGGSDA